MHRPWLATLTIVGALFASTAWANQEDEVKAAFDRFVAAQNAHDLAAVRDLLLDSPDFLWVTRGIVVWGRQAALDRFETLYRGTWKLTPYAAGPHVVRLSDDVAQLVASVTFNIGQPGQPAPDTQFVLTQAWVRTDAGWKVASLLPIPVPVAPPAAPAAAEAARAQLAPGDGPAAGTLAR